MPYTRHVAGYRNAAIFAALICLPAVAHAGVPLALVPHVSYSARDIVTGQAASTSLGGWEVTAGYDPIRCQVYCIYRQKPDAFGRTPLAGLLAPPITIVEVYTGPASRPATVIFDPAGLGLPSATAKFVPNQEKFYLPGRKLALTLPDAPANSDTPASYRARPLPTSTYTGLTLDSVTPLRI